MEGLSGTGNPTWQSQTGRVWVWINSAPSLDHLDGFAPKPLSGISPASPGHPWPLQVPVQDQFDLSTTIGTLRLRTVDIRLLINKCTQIDMENPLHYGGCMIYIYSSRDNLKSLHYLTSPLTFHLMSPTLPPPQPKPTHRPVENRLGEPFDVVLLLPCE